MQFEQYPWSAASRVMSTCSQETQDLARFSLLLIQREIHTGPRYQLGVSKRYGRRATKINRRAPTKSQALGLIKTKI